MATGAGREAGRMGGDGVTLGGGRCDQQVIDAVGFGVGRWRWRLDGGGPRMGVDGFAEDAVGDGDDR